VWSHQLEQPNNHSLFAQAFGIGSMVTLGGFLVLLMDVAREFPRESLLTRLGTLGGRPRHQGRRPAEEPWRLRWSLA